MSLGHHGNIGTAYGLEAVSPETERTTATTAAFGDEELQLPTVPFTFVDAYLSTWNTCYCSLIEVMSVCLSSPILPREIPILGRVLKTR